MLQKIFKKNIDTTAVLEIIFGTEKGEKLKQETKGKATYLTPFTIQEIIISRKNKETELINKIINSSFIIDFGKNEAIESAYIERELKSEGKIINKVDIFIGGIARSHEATIITTDSDFKRIKNLKVKII